MIQKVQSTTKYDAKFNIISVTAKTVLLECQVPKMQKPGITISVISNISLKCSSVLKWILSIYEENI